MIGFAHRGAPGVRSEENTLSAFERALALGARGIESDVLLTRDGVPVLVHAGIPWRRPRVSQMTKAELPAHIPSLKELYERCGTDFDLALDMAAPLAATEVVRVAAAARALQRLWLTYWRRPALVEWRTCWPEVKLVYPAMPVGRRKAIGLIESLAAIGVTALNVHHRLCTRRLVEQSHAAGLLLFAWGVKDARSAQRMAEKGVDGIFCDDAAALGRLATDGLARDHTAS